MDDREPTVRARELGDALREAMRGAGLTASQIARRMEWSQSRVSRLLSGKRGGTEYDVLAFLTLCGVVGKERDRLMALCREQYRQSWLQQHGARLPKQLRTLIGHEDKATKISQFESTLVPGLLQTPQYARALLVEAGTVPEEEIGERVDARMGRHALFGRPHPPMLTFFIHEFVLRLPVGGREVMSDQLHHLLRMSVRSYLRLRVVPASRGAHAAIQGSFRLMEFPDIKPVAYLETETSSVFLELPEEISAYRTILARLEDTALDEGQSKEFIANMAIELYADREDQDALTTMAQE
jgi:transcriptional regulator with XRE-family HTH domain